LSLLLILRFVNRLQIGHMRYTLTGNIFYNNMHKVGNNSETNSDLTKQGPLVYISSYIQGRSQNNGEV